MGRGLSGAAAIALGLPLVIALPLAVTTRYGPNLLILAAAWSISTLGLTVLLGYAGQISLAQSTFFGIGAYAVALGTARWGVDWWLALPLGLGAATAARVVLGMTTLKLGGHYLAKVTLSFHVKSAIHRGASHPLGTSERRTRKSETYEYDSAAGPAVVPVSFRATSWGSAGLTMW